MENKLKNAIRRASRITSYAGMDIKIETKTFLPWISISVLERIWPP